jgi:hypothetical protein
VIECFYDRDSCFQCGGDVDRILRTNAVIPNQILGVFRNGPSLNTKNVSAGINSASFTPAAQQLASVSVVLLMRQSQLGDLRSGYAGS